MDIMLDTTGQALLIRPVTMENAAEADCLTPESSVAEPGILIRCFWSSLPEGGLRCQVHAEQGGGGEVDSGCQSRPQPAWAALPVTPAPLQRWCLGPGLNGSRSLQSILPLSSSVQRNSAELVIFTF